MKQSEGLKNLGLKEPWLESLAGVWPSNQKVLGLTPTGGQVILFQHVNSTQ